jgi:hypothetical protein
MRVENVFNLAFGDKLNPFYHLGTISFWQFWLLVGTGFYLYIFADTGVHDAFDRSSAITHNQWWAGGIMRSIHRYATDGMILTMLLHMLRHFAYDRYRGFRWFSWLTGVALLVARLHRRPQRLHARLGQAGAVRGHRHRRVVRRAADVQRHPDPQLPLPKTSTAACSPCSPSSTSAPR